MLIMQAVDEQFWQLEEVRLVRELLYHPTVYVWVDKEVHSPENRFNYSHFSAIGQTHACTSVEQAYELISGNKQLFRVITSASLGKETCQRLSQLDNVIHIYVFCQYLPAGQQLKAAYAKVKFVATDLQQCLQYIEENKRLDNKFKTLPNFITINSKDRSLVNSCRFNLHHLLSCRDRERAKQDFASLARQIYPQDRDIKRFLADYEYGRQSIFKWYTLECFYYKVLNNILRCGFNPLTTAYVRLPFTDVFRAVRQLYALKRPSKPHGKGCEKFYRGGWISEEQFQLLRNNQKGFIEIMGFLSTSKSKKVAEEFLRRNPNESNRILYTVKVLREERCPDHDYGFVDISHFSKYQQEEEVLFNALNVFQVSSVRIDNGLKRATLIYGSLAAYSEKYRDGEHLDPDQLMMVLNSRYQRQAMNRIIDQGDLLKACEMYDEAVHYKQALLAAIKPDRQERIASVESSLGQCYTRKGNHTKAMEFYRSALQRLANLPQQTSLRAEVYDNFGRCLHEQGSYQESLLYTQKSLDETIKSGGDQSLDAAVRLGNLGVVHLSLGNLQQSVQLHRRSQQLCLQVVGEIHLSTATSYNNLGSSLHSIGEVEQAIECYNKCLTISEAVLGNHNKDIATVYNNLGLSYHKQHKFEQAIELYRKSLVIKQSKQSTTKNSLAASYTNLGLSYKCKGDFQLAVDHYQHAIELIKEQQSVHPMLAVCYNNLGQCYQSQCKFQEAVSCYEAALTLANNSNKASQQHAHINGSIGMCLVKLGRNTEGRTYLFKALKLLEEVLGKEKCKQNGSYKLYLLCLASHPTTK